MKIAQRNYNHVCHVFSIDINLINVTHACPTILAFVGYKLTLLIVLRAEALFQVFVYRTSVLIEDNSKETKTNQSSLKFSSKVLLLG